MEDPQRQYQLTMEMYRIKILPQLKREETAQWVKDQNEKRFVLGKRNFTVAELEPLRTNATSENRSDNANEKFVTKMFRRFGRSGVEKNDTNENRKQVSGKVVQSKDDQSQNENNDVSSENMVGKIHQNVVQKETIGKMNYSAKMEDSEYVPSENENNYASSENTYDNENERIVVKRYKKIVEKMFDMKVKSEVEEEVNWCPEMDEFENDPSDDVENNAPSTAMTDSPTKFELIMQKYRINVLPELKKLRTVQWTMGRNKNEDTDGDSVTEKSEIDHEYDWVMERYRLEVLPDLKRTHTTHWVKDQNENKYHNDLYRDYETTTVASDPGATIDDDEHNTSFRGRWRRRKRTIGKWFRGQFRRMFN